MVWLVAAACAGLLGLWLALLWWLCEPLPGERPILVLRMDTMQEAQWAGRQYEGVRNFGIRLVIVTGEENRERLECCTKAEIWTPEEYLRYLETERNRIAGTGNGNYPGCDQRRGLSEL